MLRAQQIQVIRDQQRVLNLEEITLSPGQVIAVLGPNGAGKSTLLQVLSGSLIPQAGTVEIDGQHLQEMMLRDRAQRLAVLSQANQIPFPLSIMEVVLLGRTPHDTTQARNLEIAHHCLQQVDLQVNSHRYYSHLSGGEQQRVQIARVLAQLFNENKKQTRFLLLDEPINGLDLPHQHRILHLLQELALDNISVFTSIHDLNLSLQYTDQVVLLKQGNQIAKGHPNDILTPELVQHVFDLPVTAIVHPECVDKKIIIPLTYSK